MNVTLFLLIHTVILFILHLQVLQDSGKFKNTSGGGSLNLRNLKISVLWCVEFAVKNFLITNKGKFAKHD